MSSISSIFRKVSLLSTAFILSFCSLLLASGNVFADDAVPCTPPTNNQNGVHWPVGADAATFTYQCDGSYAGYWTNAYYKYDPVTTKRIALYSPDYTYDCTNNTWAMTEWDYSPANGTFIKNQATPATAPSLPTNCPVPVTATTNPASASSVNNNSAVPTATTITSSGPNSNNTAATNGTVTSNTTNSTNLSMNNGISSSTTTGSSLVIGNTTGGSATTGDAQAIANIANLLQSTSNAFGSGAITFTANINGDITGDFMFDPSAVLASGPGSNNDLASNMQINTNNSNSTNAQINNAIDVGATSGNATVASNTTGGNATTGNATAVVNLMNLINSTVAAGQSFIGTININGDLNGDILLPENVLNQLLASTGPDSSNNSATSTTNSTTVANNITEAVVNNLASSAATGDATVASNTNAGTATSGSGGTNVTLLNLTGSNTVGKDDLLVFVNVLGKWVGMIMNAPVGSTAAELGGNITSSGPNSNNVTAASSSTNMDIINNATLGITNNINAHATSGNATVTNNTNGGNAISGSAHTAVNVLNLLGSNISLSDWFGVLFINVFGTWNGSFGVNTSAGDPPTTSTQNPIQQASHEAVDLSLKQFASFIGRSNNSDHRFVASSVPTGSSSTASQAVLGSMIVAGNKAIPDSHTPTASKPPVDTATHSSYWLLAGGVGLSLVILLAGERERFFGRSH
jgi:hypothetical protein